MSQENLENNSYDYDLFVIGAGSGGLAASKRAASYGAKVAIAEGDLVGGTCVIRGCVPKKLMVYASRFPHHMEAAPGYGWKPVKSKLKWRHLIESVDKEVKRLSKLHITWLEKAGVELIPHRATLIDPHTIQTGDKTFTAAKILIAVGGEAIKPDIPGAKKYTITSREMFLLHKKPKHIVVIGAGYIAVEFAGIMQGLGSKVTQLIRGDLFLRGFDEDIRQGIFDGMTHSGINIVTNIQGKRIEKVSQGIRVTYTQAGEEKEKSVTADVVLMAIGRAPLLEGLGLENAGVETDEGAIIVDNYSRTSQPHIFAVGDCTNRINLTPVAIGEGRAFADTEFGSNHRVFSHLNVPSAIFSQPEAATVGLTERGAIDLLGEEGVQIYRARFRPMFYSLTEMEEKTMVKLVVDKKTDRILGAHMVGDYAAEVVQGVAIAVNMGATKKDFDATVGIHPSTAEEFVTLR
jgi:glutathione reductase (NADPH)